MGQTVSRTEMTPANARNELTLNWITFILSPLLGVLLAWKPICNRRYGHIYILASVFAVFGAFFPPLSDAYRYRIAYLTTTSFSLDFSQLYTTQKDFLYSLLSYIFNSAGIAYDFFKLIMFLICYWAYSWMYIDIVKHSKTLSENKRFYILGLITVLFSIRLFTMTNGIRFGLASAIVIIGVYRLYRHRIWSGFAWIVLSCTLHFSMLMIFPCLAGGWLLQKITLKRWHKFAIIFCLLAFSHSAIGTLLTTFLSDNELVTSNVNGYIEGKWNTESLINTASFGGLMFTILRIFPVIPLSYYVVNSRRTLLQGVIFMLLVVLSISFSSYTLLLRYSNVANAILLVALLVTLQPDRTSYKKLKIACVAFLMVFGSYVYSQRHPLTTVLLPYKVLLSPVMLIDEPGYSQHWVDTHVDRHGELRR